MQKIVKCTKPENLEPPFFKGEHNHAAQINGHTFQGHWDKAGEYYEHDETADQWYHLADQNPEPSQQIPYRCRTCGVPITAAEGDDNTELCDDCNMEA